MIIFGTRRKTHRLAMLVLPCRTCGSPQWASLDKSVTKFSLFFVPLFPVHVKRALTCTRCGTTDKVGKTDARQLQQQARQQPGA